MKYVITYLVIKTTFYCCCKVLNSNVQPKSVLKGRRSEFDGLIDDENDEAYDLPEESSPTNLVESPPVEHNVSVKLSAHNF